MAAVIGIIGSVDMVLNILLLVNQSINSYLHDITEEAKGNA